MLEQWCFEYRREWRKLPLWCTAYSVLGCAIAAYGSQDKRLVAGLATPTRAYAAAFVALGVVYRRANEPVAALEEDDHFLALCGLEPGTAVSYLENGKLKDAVFEGYEEKYGQFYLRIRKNADHCIDYVPPACATRVQVSSKEGVKLSKHQRGRAVVEEGGLLTSCLGGLEPFDYCLNSRLEGVLIGNKAALYQEVKHTTFAIRGEKGDFCKGALQDVVRVRQLVGDGLGYRTSVHSEREAALVSDAESPPRVVIFDGASSFLKWRDAWRASHWVVVLDRTETGFEEAVNALNRECLENRSSLTPPPLPAPPPQVDMLSYEEAR